MKPQVFRIEPGVADEGRRLDQVVPEHVAELSRTLVRKVVDLGGIHVGGRRVRRCSHPIRAGEGVEVYLDGLPLSPYRLRQEEILFRDRFLLALHKPAGVASQPTPARFKGTLYEALQVFLRDPFRPREKPTIGMVQRLDRDTSGVLVVSIHPRAHRGLTRSFAERDNRKIYLALLSGRLGQGAGEFRSLLARQRSTNRMKTVARGGREAITRYRVLATAEDATLVRVEIPTGRSHQIRAHFAEAGHPLLGDGRYGGPSSFRGGDLPRQMLHALCLEVEHPVTGEPLSLTAPVPEDFREVLRQLGWGELSCAEKLR